MAGNLTFGHTTQKEGAKAAMFSYTQNLKT